MQTVRDVIGMLSRFNPDALMEYELEVSSLSPSTICKLVTVSFGEKDEELEKENQELDERCNELIEGSEKIVKILREMGIDLD